MQTPFAYQTQYDLASSVVIFNDDDDENSVNTIACEVYLSLSTSLNNGIKLS